VEDVPGTLHHITTTVTTVLATAGETPRILDRMGQGAGGSVSAAAPVATPATRTTTPIRAAKPEQPTQRAAEVVRDNAGPRHLRQHSVVLRDRPGKVRRHAPRLSPFHRMPLPYAPTAPASVTAGPAVSSSNAAGPAFSLPRAGLARRQGGMIRIAQGTGPDPLLTIAHAPGHTPD
jgi:hypothetical protein